MRCTNSYSMDRRLRKHGTEDNVLRSSYLHRGLQVDKMQNRNASNVVHCLLTQLLYRITMIVYYIVDLAYQLHFNISQVTTNLQSALSQSCEGQDEKIHSSQRRIQRGVLGIQRGA